MKTKTNRLLALLLVVVLAISMTACGSGSTSYDDGYYSGVSNSISAMDSISAGGVKTESAMSPMAPVPSPSPEMEDGTDNETASYLESQKLIYTCDVSIETKDFKAAQENIRTLIQKYNGIISHSSVSDSAYGWYHNSYEKTSGTLREDLTVRIPTKHYNDFVNGISEVGKVLRKNENVENITREYSDVETTIKSLKIQEDRLLEMLESCTTIPDMITVESRLAEVQRQLERYQTQLIGMDMDIQFSTITIDLNEVGEFSTHLDEITFMQEFKEAVVDSWRSFREFVENVTIGLVYCAPYLIILAICVVLFIKLVKVCQKQNQANKLKKEMNLSDVASQNNNPTPNKNQPKNKK